MLIMPKKIAAEKLEQIIKSLPTKDRLILREQALSEQWLEEKIADTKSLMKRDLWLGLPLMLLYLGTMAWAYFTQQNIVNNITLSAGVLAFGYFAYTVFTTGSYGTNKKRLAVYEELLKAIK